jgi:D-alanyl-D-alanine carboxypeptidase/D-alanyl-D-alanine-endopeptidase (penicillin-binding protein 4)
MPRPLLAFALIVTAASASLARGLPDEVERALRQAQVPVDNVAVIVQEVGGGKPRLALHADEPMNPASLTKLLTTYAALDMLGSAWNWRTPVWLRGSLSDGVLDGSLVIQGSGDPTLVIERLWLLLRRVRQLGVREIRGDIVLDRSAFAAADMSPADFDNEPSKPYNVQPDALLLNYKAVSYSFTPDPARGVASIGVEPALARVQVDASVPLLAGPCNDWRAALKAAFGDAQLVRFAGGYPAACGERVWNVAYADPGSYNARVVETLWREMGGRLSGTVRDGVASPLPTPPSFEVVSPPLAEVVRDINKFSNNTMAQQLFLTLALQQRGAPATPQAARDVLSAWLGQRFGERAASETVLVNGSGLSRDTRVSAQLLARVLQAAWASPQMPELMASLPVSGIDGTLLNSRAPAGRAHLKTGSLRDVAGVAGYVLADSGKRYVLVALVNHPNANAARSAIDALVQWTLRDAHPPRLPHSP